MTPAIELGGTVILLVGPGRLDVGAHLQGDGFPSAQIVLQDWTGNRILVHSHDSRLQVRDDGLVSVGQRLRGVGEDPSRELLSDPHIVLSVAGWVAVTLLLIL